MDNEVSNYSTHLPQQLDEIENVLALSSLAQIFQISF